MFIKSIVTVCLFSVALAGLVPVKRSYEYSAPPPAPAHWEKEHWKPANYEFQYDVNDHHTGDIKEQHEKAENGKVTGHYSLVEPDGLHRRIVEYTADAEHGFVVSFNFKILVKLFKDLFLKFRRMFDLNLTTMDLISHKYPQNIFQHHHHQLINTFLQHENGKKSIR